MTIVTSKCGVTRKYFTEDGILKAAVLRDTDERDALIKHNKELQDNVDHAAIMAQNSVFLASIDEADWIKVMQENGVEKLYSDEAMEVAKRVFLQGGDWRYTRVVPDKYISHEGLKK